MLNGFLLIAGCGPQTARLSLRERAIAEAARPILEMAPDAVWTDAYNRLVELAPASIAYLAEHPALSRPAAPDDLRVLVHASLLRLLVHPGARPVLAANCLETTLDVLHFDLKVSGQRIGTPCLPERHTPRTWHDLYPADFDHELAGRIDAEADRLAVQHWWLEYRARPHSFPAAPRLRPRADPLWRLLARRYADHWTYEPEAKAIRCAGTPPDQAMVRAATSDYNLVRAACVWLGSSGRPEIRERLIDLAASPVPVVAHNALFALQYDPDDRVRDLLERYKDVMDRNPRPAPNGLTAPPTPRPDRTRAEWSRR